MKKIVVLSMLVMICVGLTGCGAKGFEAILKDSEATMIYGNYEIGDDDSYLSVRATTSYGNSTEVVQKINAELGFGEAMWEKMLETRAIDGMQSEENGNFTVSWTYHPDNGLNVIYERK